MGQRLATNRMRRRAPTVGAIVLLLSGCVSTGQDDLVAQIDAPASWSALSTEMSGAAESITTDWLGDLQDPTVTRLVTEAITHNNTLAVSAARARATRERVGITRAGLLPSLSASVSGDRTRTPGSDALGTSASYANAGQSQASLSWELDVWGRLTDGTRAAYLGAFAAQFDVASAELSIAGATAQSYYRLTEARLQRQLSERDVETGAANLRIIERRYNRGISSSLDVRLARSSLAQSEATLISRQQAEQEATRGLEVLLGRYPSASLTAATALPPLDSLTEVGGASLGTPATLMARRPDVLAAEHRLKSSGLSVSEARKAFLPQLTITGVGQASGTQLDELLDVDNVLANLAAGLTQPLFQGGRLRAQAKAAKADMDAALYTYADTMLTAYQEVENAVAAERFLAAREEAQMLAYEEAAASEELTTRQYLNGTTNIFNLISAQQRRISSESSYISAALARLTNRIDLYLALGAPFTAIPPEAELTASALEGARL